MRHKGLSLKISPDPCSQWAHGRHPQLWRYANPGQLSDIAFNLSRAKPSIKLFGIWQLLKGQRGIKHSRTRMKMSSLPHNLLSFNTQDKQSTHTQHTPTHSYIMLSARYIGLFGRPTSTLCINRKHALSLLSWRPFTARAHAYYSGIQQPGLWLSTLNSWASTSFHCAFGFCSSNSEEAHSIS